jgi:hypothetical protein
MDCPSIYLLYVAVIRRILLYPILYLVLLLLIGTAKALGANPTVRLQLLEAETTS